MQRPGRPTPIGAAPAPAGRGRGTERANARRPPPRRRNGRRTLSIAGGRPSPSSGPPALFRLRLGHGLRLGCAAGRLIRPCPPALCRWAQLMGEAADENADIVLRRRRVAAGGLIAPKAPVGAQRQFRVPPAATRRHQRPARSLHRRTARVQGKNLCGRRARIRPCGRGRGGEAQGSDVSFSVYYLFVISPAF